MTTAVYWRHHARFEATFESFEAALVFLAAGEDYGELSSQEIRDGDRVVEGDELFKLEWELQRRWDAERGNGRVARNS